MFEQYHFKIVVLFMLSIFLGGCGSSSSKTKNELSTPSIDKSTPLRIACVGDSITEGYMLPNPSVESYPAQLAKLVVDGVVVKNFGIRGATALINSNYPYWNTSQYENSKLFTPDIVVLMFGTNDIKSVNWKNRSSFISNYSTLIKSYKKLSSKPTVYICFPPPSYTSVQGMTNKRIIEELKPDIEKVARLNEVKIIDIHALLSQKESLFPDKIHPNSEGARQIALEVYKVIY